MTHRLAGVVLSLLVAPHPGWCATAAEPGPEPATGPYEVSCLVGTSAGDTLPAAAALRDYAQADFDAFSWAAGPGTNSFLPLAARVGFAAQADGGYRLANGAVFGVRMGAVYTVAGANLTATSDAGDRLEESWSLDAGMVPVLVGGWIEHRLSKDVMLRGSLFAGPAFGSVTILNTWDASGPSIAPSKGASLVAYHASTFDADLGAEFNWYATRHLTLVIEAGYRFCRFIAMRARRDFDTNGDGRTDIAAGDAFQDGRGLPVPFNFSGYKIDFGLRWRFER